MAKQILGVTFTVPAGRSATPVYLSDGGAPVFETDEPYLLSDGRSLAAPLPVVLVDGPVHNAQAALAVSGLNDE